MKEKLEQEKKELEDKLKSFEGKEIPKATVKKMTDEFVKNMREGGSNLNQEQVKLTVDAIKKVLEK